jgi:UDP-glucose 4-epimerase
MKKHVLVSGGAGYVGSHACKALKGCGYIPVTVDNLSTGWQDAVKFGPFEKVDLLNREDLSQIFERYKPASVMHFAASSQVSESVKNPGKYWRNNVLGSLNLIEMAIKYNCLNFIFSSTCATYGDNDNVVLTERTLQNPTNSYGTSKRAVEEMITQFAESNGLKFVIYRYFNVAGADPEAEIGEFHCPETHLIPLVLDAAVGKRDMITIFGTNYDTPDGTCIRDYVHVCDLVDAHILGLNWLEKGGANRVYNLGPGHGFSVLEVINETQELTNKKILQKKGKRREGDCAKLVSGSQLAKEELGWVPKRSNLKQMITDAWRWHQTSGYKE